MKKTSICMAAIAMMLYACSTGELRKDKLNNSEEKSGISSITESNSDKEKATDTTRFTPPHILNTTSNENWDKKIIKTADVVLELKNYMSYDKSIHKGLIAFGAYIAGEEQHFTEGRFDNSITIKVPAEQFDNLLNSFSGDSIRVLEKKISSEDVTGELIDTKLRTEAKKQMHSRYLELLKQAKNMKEILEVQQELNSIREEIESGEGRVNYLNHQSAFSTIHLQYFQYTGPGNSSNGNSIGFLARLKEGFKTGTTIIGNLFVFIVTIWPLLLIGFMGFLFWRKHTSKPI
jgi:hypothetical protein